MSETNELYRCNNCRFWLQESMGSVGQCRRYPPSVEQVSMEFPSATNPSDEEAAPAQPILSRRYPRYPKTLDFDWCGEYKRKVDTEGCFEEKGV